MTPCVPAGIVVFCPLGIWIASQSRLNVNSVFSYMASFYVIPSEVEESLDLSLERALFLFLARNGSKDYATNRENYERLAWLKPLKVERFIIVSSFVIRISSFS